jgi:hypothetical protein
MKKKFYKTVFTFEVLSEEPLESMSLSDLEYETSEGHCVGRFGETTSEELTEEQVCDELIEFGSQPEFFDIN